MSQKARFVIYGTQRTGTIFLMTLLDSHPDILCIGELFQPKSECVQYSIPRYRLYLENSTTYQFLDSALERVKLDRFFGATLRRITINKYLDTIFFSRAATNYTAIGFKLMLDQAKRYPSVLDYLRRNKFKIIHLTRENILKIHISRLRAQQTGVYASNHSAKKIKVRVPIDSLLEDLDLLSDQNDELESSVSRLGLDYLTVKYEQLTHSREPELRRILSFLMVRETVELQARVVKLTPDSLEQAVENYKEMRDALEHTRYASYVH
jgi:LPS sulfotransferase NodH